MEHYRAAIAFDPLLRTPWANLAIHALEENVPEQALHLAGVALFLDPGYETALQVVERARSRMPSEEERRRRASAPCPAGGGGGTAESAASPASAGGGERPAAGAPRGPANLSAAAPGGSADVAAGAPGRPTDVAAAAAGGSAGAPAPERPADEGAHASGPGPAGAGLPGLGADPTTACLERRAGWLAGLGADEAAPLVERARLELGAGRAQLAALLLRMARGRGGGDPGLEADALARTGDPCGAVETGRARKEDAAACEALRGRRDEVQAALGLDLSGASPTQRAFIAGRIETFLRGGLDGEAVARRLRTEWRRGDRPLRDLSAVTLRLGDEWFEASDPAERSVEVWRRRPGDSAFVVFTLPVGSGTTAETALAQVLALRRPGPLLWAAAPLAATDPARTRTALLSIDADPGRVEGRLWLSEADAASGTALVIAAFPGGGGLGAEGIEKNRDELLEAVNGAVLVPVRWPLAPALPRGEGFPIPVTARERGSEGDERESPWRAYPAGEFTVALPPGTLAAPPARATAQTALERPTARLWFRGRFRDRDGSLVGIGDEWRAGSVDVFSAAGAAEATSFVLPAEKETSPPLSDPGAKLLSAIDATKTLGRETGSSAISVARFQATGPGVEWIVARLAYGPRIVEIDIPAIGGSQSVALYWIPSTVRTIDGPPPSPPVDLSGRSGISFFTPPPAERRESFFKEGDLVSRSFKMVVAHGFKVTLNSDAPEGFPVRMSHASGNAVVLLERTIGEALAGETRGDADAPPTGMEGAAATRTSAADRSLSSDAWLRSSIEAFLSRNGFALERPFAPQALSRPSRYGAVSGRDASFAAVRLPADPAPAPGRNPLDSGRAGPAGEAGKGSEEAARGRAVLLEAKDGGIYLFSSLCWGPGSRQRQEEIELMLSSLRLSSRGGDKPPR